jgi:ATP-dependent RNA helicase HelY
VAGLAFALDDFQVRAIDALDAGRSVLVAAPTGSGKTVVAEYAVARARAEGGKVFYTTPLKALSNQKFGDFRRALGERHVGLLTGDNSINGEAPVVVMTTEVLRNMIYAESPTLAGLRYVVLDEVHYLQDAARGPVWEEVIVHLPDTVTLVALSATVSNAEEVGDWLQTVRGETEVVVEERRPVQLRHLYMLGDRDSGDVHLLPTFVGDDYRLNPEAARLANEGNRRRTQHGGGRRRSRLFTPSRLDVLEALQADGLLPAINFIFSRAACDQAVEQCVRTGIRLTDEEERAAIVAIAERRVGVLSEDELTVLGYGAWLDALQRGIAAHHAGVVPPMKEAVEEAFAAGLVKLVFATETLALGVNMPARTVVIERLTKFTGEHHEFLTPGEYTQLTGRAGRRGIDTVGYAVALWSPFASFEQTAALASTRSYELTSSFRPTYHMAVNLVRRHDAEEAHHLLNLSFAQYHADRAVVALTHRLERTRSEVTRARREADCDRGDVDEYRRLLADWNRARHVPGGRGAVLGALDRLHPGDIVIVDGERWVVLQQAARRNRGLQIAMLTAKGRRAQLAEGDFDQAPSAVGHVDLPQPYAPNHHGWQKRTLDLARRAKLDTVPRPGRPRVSEAERLAQEVAAHPVGRCPDHRRHVNAAERLERLEREVDRLTDRVERRGDNLARRFDRVLALLESWRYVDVDRWTLTPAGELLAELGAESDLLIAEALRTGLFDGLAPASLAALASCFTYEFRGPDDERARRRIAWPDQQLVERWTALERLGRDLALAERDLGLTSTRPPDPGFVEYAHPWASGAPLEHILDDDAMAPGDFVRNVKQLLDVLRQIADHAPAPDTASAARRAADALFRGVVAASSVVGS